MPQPKEEAPAQDESQDDAAAETKEAETESAPITKVQEAQQAAERLEKATTENKKWVDKVEKLKAEDILSGRSEAGAVIPEKSEEEKIKEGAKTLVAGTGLDPFEAPAE